MTYQVRVAGKIFEGTDFRKLLKQAIEAKRAESRQAAPEVPVSRLSERKLGTVAGF